MNHIAFCISDNWTMQCGVLILSLQKFNTENFCFHIIGKKLSKSNKNKLVSTVNPNNKIEFHSISSEYDNKLILRSGDRVTIETYYRFFLPDFIDNDIDRILYLDSDIICTGNISELFNLDINKYPVGMVLDSRYGEITKYNRLNYDMKYKYFNAGVMLINLDYWRKNNVKNLLIDYVVNYPERCFYHDQDAVNSILHGSILQLPAKYNLQSVMFQYFYLNNLKDCPREIYYSFQYEKSLWNDLDENLKNPCLVHFTDFYKPWTKTTKNPFTKVWRYFFYKSPWKNKKLKFSFNPKKTFYINQIKRIIAKLENKKCIFDNYPKESYIIEENVLISLNSD